MQYPSNELFRVTRTRIVSLTTTPSGGADGTPVTIESGEKIAITESRHQEYGKDHYQFHIPPAATASFAVFWHARQFASGTFMCRDTGHELALFNMLPSGFTRCIISKNVPRASTPPLPSFVPTPTRESGTDRNSPNVTPSEDETDTDADADADADADDTASYVTGTFDCSVIESKDRIPGILDTVESNQIRMSGSMLMESGDGIFFSSNLTPSPSPMPAELIETMRSISKEAYEPIVKWGPLELPPYVDPEYRKRMQGEMSDDTCKETIATVRKISQMAARIGTCSERESTPTAMALIAEASRTLGHILPNSDAVTTLYYNAMHYALRGSTESKAGRELAPLGIFLKLLNAVYMSNLKPGPVIGTVMLQICEEFLKAEAEKFIRANSSVMQTQKMKNEVRSQHIGIVPQSSDLEATIDEMRAFLDHEPTAETIEAAICRPLKWETINEALLPMTNKPQSDDPITKCTLWRECRLNDGPCIGGRPHVKFGKACRICFTVPVSKGSIIYSQLNDLPIFKGIEGGQMYALDVDSGEQRIAGESGMWHHVIESAVSFDGSTTLTDYAKRVTADLHTDPAQIHIILRHSTRHAIAALDPHRSKIYMLDESHSNGLVDKLAFRCATSKSGVCFAEHIYPAGLDAVYEKRVTVLTRLPIVNSKKLMENFQSLDLDPDPDLTEASDEHD